MISVIHITRTSNASSNCLSAARCWLRAASYCSNIVSEVASTVRVLKPIWAISVF